MAEYIEREEAIRVLSNPIRKSMCVNINEYKYRYRQRETDLELIKSLTAADIQPVKHGKWINTMPIVEYKRFCQVKCSICGSIEAFGNFCRNCGADMRGE